MEFIYKDLGNRSRGEIVEVKLSRSAANVRLMDSVNFQNYKNGRNHRYIGGLARKSPVHLAIPASGHWYVAVDMRGLRGSTQASISILPGPLPPIQEAPLSSIPSLVRPKTTSDTNDEEREYDVFIAHASEDKEEVVRPLANAMIDNDLRVWYDEFELRIGDSLRQKIDHGISNSRVGIVVLSHSFIAKGWTKYELDGIVMRVVSGEQVLLPIWHNITKSEIIKFSPSLADKVARSTTTHTIEEIATEIADVIRNK